MAVQTTQPPAETAAPPGSRAQDAPAGDAYTRARGLGAQEGARVVPGVVFTQRARAAMRQERMPVVNRQRPTISQARDGHHTAAGHWNAPIVRVPRLAYGYLIHLPVKTFVADPLDWVFESPARLVCAVLILAALHFWL